MCRQTDTVHRSS